MKKWKVHMADGEKIFLDLGDASEAVDVQNAILRYHDNDGKFKYEIKDILQICFLGDYCNKHNHELLAASPFGGGLICVKCYNAGLVKFKQEVKIQK